MAPCPQVVGCVNYRESSGPGTTEPGQQSGRQQAEHAAEVAQEAGAFEKNHRSSLDPGGCRCVDNRKCYTDDMFKTY